MTTATADLSTLLRSILIDPADDLARLAYADALEEGGENVRAEFIRAQVEFARAPGGCQCGYGPDQALCGQCLAFFSLWRKAKDAFRADDFSWLPIREGPGTWECFDAAPPDAWTVSVRADVGGREWRQTLHRGFVSVIRLPLDAFLEHARELFSRHPVERVVLTDSRPYHETLSVAEPGPATSFWGFWDAVAHGRSLAGLPPLPSPSDQVVTCRQSPPPAP